MTKDEATTYDEAMKLARENFATAKELCDKHSKLDRRIVYGNALITHFDAVCQALALVNEVDQEQPAQQEPTKAMIDAAERIDWSGSDVRGNIVNMWQAMCAAAPQAQPAQQEVDWEKLYRLEVKKKDALAAKYERDTGKKLTRIIPMAEQPAQQQEPVAWGNFKEDGTLVGLSQHPEDQANWIGRKPLYTSPQPAQQEPVAKVYRHGRSSNGTPWHGVHWFDEGVNMPDGTLLYTAPQAQRTWVGLTDGQIEQCMKQAYSTVQGRNLELAFARAIEAAHGIYAPTELKEDA